MLTLVVFQTLGPSKGRFMMMLGCSKLLAPVVFQQVGPSKGVHDDAGVLKLADASGIPDIGPFKGEVHDDGVLKVVGAGGTPAVEPFKGGCIKEPGCSKLLAPVVFQQLGPSKARFMMMGCSKLLVPAVFQQLGPSKGGS